MTVVCTLQTSTNTAVIRKRQEEDHLLEEFAHPARYVCIPGLRRRGMGGAEAGSNTEEGTADFDKVLVSWGGCAGAVTSFSGGRLFSRSRPPVADQRHSNIKGQEEGRLPEQWSRPSSYCHTSVKRYGGHERPSQLHDGKRGDHHLRKEGCCRNDALCRDC